MTRQPGEGLEQLVLPFEGQKLYYGYCARCWGEEIIDGPHLVGMCLDCRKDKNEIIVQWEENERRCLLNEEKNATFDENGLCCYCELPKEQHCNV